MPAEISNLIPNSQMSYNNLWIYDKQVITETCEALASHNVATFEINIGIFLL